MHPLTRLAPLVVLLAACDRAPAAQWSGTISHEGGAIVVHNPATPLLDSGAVTVERRWTAPVAEQGPDGEALWAAPVELSLGRDALYVLDRQEQRVHVVSLDGRWTRSVGRKGGGPGELQGAGALALLPGAGDAGGDTLVVLDNGKTALLLFGADGRHLGDVRLPGMAFDVHALHGGKLVLSALAGRRSRWLQLATDGSSEPFPMPGVDSTGEEDGCRRYAAVGDRVLRLDCVLPAVEEIDAAGGVVRRIAIAADSVRATPAQLDSFRQRMEATFASSPVPPPVARQMIDAQLAGAAVLRRFRHVRRDPVAGLWAILEQPPEDLGGGPATVHLLSPDGVYLARLAMGREWRDFALRDGTLYALEVSPDDDLPRVVAIAVGLPPDALARAAAAFRARAGAAGADGA